MEWAMFAISLVASVVGAICGIGGGAIIKPVLDFFAFDTVATISFLSGCTVLAMSFYSVGKSVAEKDKSVDYRFCTPLAIGAAVGGVVGKLAFDGIITLAGNDVLVGRIQSVSMLIITIGTFWYTLKKDSIKTLQLKGATARILLGLALGIVSSFLGIGGGPIKLVAFFYFFSMDTKTASKSSLFIILTSQLASLVTALALDTVPDFSPLSMALMVLGGILGGVIGRAAAKKMSNKDIDKVFLAVMALIIAISAFNAIR